MAVLCSVLSRHCTSFVPYDRTLAHYTTRTVFVNYFQSGFDITQQRKLFADFLVCVPAVIADCGRVVRWWFVLIQLDGIAVAAW